MKKSLFYFSTFLLCLCFLYTSCKNFLNGSNLKAELEQQIEIANAPETRISINIINNDCGMLPREGYNSVKLKVPFNLDFSPSDDYQFMHWGVFYKNSSDYENNSDFNFSAIDNKSYPMIIDESKIDPYSPGHYQYIYEYKKWLLPESILKFDDVTSPNTKATVLDNSKEIVIVPLCARRPYVKVFSNENELLSYNAKGNFTIRFNDEVTTCSNGKIKICDSSRRTFSEEYNNINKNYIKIYAKPSKDSDDHERKDITHLFYINQDNPSEIRLSSFNSTIYNDSSWYRNDNGNLISIFDSEMESITKGYKTRYIEVEISGSLYLNRNTAVTARKNIKVGFTQGAIVDKEPPVFKDTIYYLPDSNTTVYEGVSNYDKEVDRHRRYKISDVWNGTESIAETPVNINYVANACRSTSNSNISRRVKNSFYFYTTLLDSASKDSIPLYDSNVDSLWYGLRRVSNSNGEKTTSTDVLPVYYEQMSGSGVKIQQNLKYVNGKAYHCSKDDYSLIGKNGIGILFKLNLSSPSTFPEGLYCFEATGRDVFGNYGDTSVYSSDPDKCKTGSWDSDNDILEWARHNTQFWFIIDRTAPRPDASQFTILNPGKVYGSSNISEFGLSKDGTGVYDSNRKIKDYNADNNENFTSLKTYRICKVFASDAEAASWEPTGDEPEWRLTYGNDYIFEEVYGNDSWHPSNMQTGNYHVYAYVKDDVGNISNRIKIENAINYDKTAPEVYSKELFCDVDGYCFRFKFNEQNAGLSKIYYEIKDTEGNIYNEIDRKNNDNLGIYYGRYLNTTDDYSVDTTNHIINFNTPLKSVGTNSLYVYIKDFDNETNGTIKFTLEDAVGNKGEEQIINWY